jgi:arylsulfatase A-like enzyme
MPDRPNVLILMTDQQRFDALGAAGNAEIHTPNLDALAGEGALCRRFVVQAPVCMPSRMSMLSGLYPAALGVVTNGPAMPEDVDTIATRFGSAGYRTANIGKLHFLPHSRRDHAGRHPSYGFDHLEISDEPGCYADAYRAWVGRVAPEQLPHISLGLPAEAEKWQQTAGRDGIDHPDRGERQPRVFSGASAVTHSAFVAERTIAYLRQVRPGGGPFLCIAGFYSPHSPWVAPAEFFDLYDRDALSLPELPPELEEQRLDRGLTDEYLRSVRQAYYAMVSEVDHHCGRILNALDDRGLRENTIVVFTSDHGEWLGEGLRFGKGPPGQDCVSRVPMLLRYPAGGLGEGRTVDHLTEAVDLLPTLLAWSGLPVPGELQGRPLPLGPTAQTPPRSSALTESRHWKLLRTDRFRYHLRADGREELNDLQAPWGAWRDVSGRAEYAQPLSMMRAELARRLIERERYRPMTARY